jgi:hypothetical protein
MRRAWLTDSSQRSKAFQPLPRFVLAEKFAETYWDRHGLKTGRFIREQIGQGKTPDFRVFKSGSW